MSVGQEKVAIALIVLAAHIAGLTLVVSARDYGQYEDVPQLDFGQKFTGSPSVRDVEHGIFLHDLVSGFEHEPHAAEVSKGCPTTFEV